MKTSIKIQTCSIITIFLSGIYAALLVIWILALKNNSKYYTGDEIYRSLLFLGIFSTLFLLKIITALMILKHSPGLRKILKVLLIGDVSGGFFVCYFLNSMIPAILFTMYYLYLYFYFLPKVYDVDKNNKE